MQQLKLGHLHHFVYGVQCCCMITMVYDVTVAVAPVGAAVPLLHAEYCDLGIFTSYASKVFWCIGPLQAFDHQSAVNHVTLLLFYFMSCCPAMYTLL